MKSFVFVTVVSLSTLVAVPALAQERWADVVIPPRPAPPVKEMVIHGPIKDPPRPKQVPLLIHHYIGKEMMGEEVLAVAAQEYAHLAKVIGEYGPHPSFEPYQKEADAHFAEGLRRLGEEVKQALQNATVAESPEEAFRRDVETLGREVAEALSKETVGPTPEEQFARDVEKLGKEVADILSRETVGPAPRTFEEEIEALSKEVSAILSNGSIGSNAPRYSPTGPSTSAKPAKGTSTGKAHGAGMARD